MERCGRSTNTKLRSLIDICACKITSDFRTTKEALATIPNEVYDVLLAVAISNGYSPATKLLVSSWPYQVLNLRKVLACLSCDVSTQKLLDEIHKTIMVTIVNAVASSSCCQAKVVDLQGVKLSCDDMTNCLTALFNGLEQRQPSESSQVNIICDWTVEARNFNIVSMAMTELSESSPVTLQCGILKAEGLKEHRLIQLIKFLKRDIAHGLNLSMNSLSHSGIKDVLPHVKRLRNIQSLDISYNILNLQRDFGNTVCHCIQDVLSCLTKIHTISLGYNRITGRLRDILSPLQFPLRCLRLDKCFLNSGDLSYIANMPLHSMEELDLSGNSLSDCIPSLENVLLRSCHSLVVLFLDDTSLANSELSVSMLIKTARNFTKLRKFSLQHNHFVTEEQIGIVTAYAAIHSMTQMMITVEVTSHFDDNLFEDFLLGGSTCDLEQYTEAIDKLCKTNSRQFTLKVRDERTGCCFTDPLTFNL